jgi:hypothetical protein
MWFFNKTALRLKLVILGGKCVKIVLKIGDLPKFKAKMQNLIFSAGTFRFFATFEIITKCAPSKNFKIHFFG